MSARKIRGHWYVDLRHAGRRFRKRSPDDSRAGAIAYEATLRNRIARGEPIVPRPPKPPPPRFDTFAWRWFHTYVETNNKPSEQKSKRLVLQKHLVPFFGKLPLDAINALGVEEFKANKLNAGLAPKTVNNFLAVLGKCLRCAEEWRELERVPKIKFLRVPPQKFDFLSSEEAERLIEAAWDEHWRSMVLIALRTGLRLGELLALDWADVSLESKLLTVRRSAFGAQLVSTKNNRIRHVPLTNRAVQAFEAVWQPKGLVFSRRRPLPLNEKVPRRAIANLCTRAGLRRIGWHTLRHTFASQLVMAGVSMRAIQELLGHSDIRMTMRYAHLAPSVLYDAVRLLEHPSGPRDSWASGGQRVLGQPEPEKLKMTGNPSHS